MKTSLQFKNPLGIFLGLIVFLAMQSNSWAQIVAFNNTWSGSPATVNATTNDPNLNTTVLSRGAGITASSSSAGFRATGFASGATPTFANNDYFSFTITANSGYLINLNNATIAVGLGASGTGPQSYGIYTSLGGFTSTASQIGANLTATTGQSRSFPAAGYNGLASIEIRIYGWNASAAGGTGGPSAISVTGAVVVSNTAPTASNVQISGTTEVGQTLTGSFNYADTESDPQGTSTYRWFRADNNAGLNEAVIGGETGITYNLTATDASRYIRFGVTPVATTGTSPGVETYSGYAGPVTTSTNALSTITADPGFISPSNIDYTAFLGTDVTGTSLEVAQFIVTDVADMTDDGLSTTLTDLTFSLSSFEQYERVALYDDTNTEIQELAATATLNFSGLSIEALSGSTKTFSIRVTFKSVVTDNVQPQLTVTAATADSNGSFFDSADAGGASSSVANDDNKIEVEATVLEFVQNVTNTNFGSNMTPAVTVEAVDANQNTDLDFTDIVSITSTGTLAAPQNENAVAGLATFSTINHTAPQIGVQLTAAATGLSSAQSGLFNVTVQEAGELLLEENFSFTGLLTSNGYTLTGGAASPTLSAGATTLSYAGYGSTNIGNALTLATSGQDVNKTFAQQNAGTTTYFSFLVNASAANATGDYFIHLGPTVIATEFRGRVYARLSAGNLQFGVSSTGGTVVYSNTNYALNTTYLVVVKYFFNGTSQTASLFVNPSLTSEPSVADITQTTALASTNIGALGIRQGGAANSATVTLDGIRVATNWGALLGNPQYMANATINGGNYNSVSIIDGTIAANGSITVNDAINVSGTGNLDIPNNTNLIQQGTTNNNTGNITVHRNALMKRLDYVYWSSPVDGQNILDFSPLTFTNRFYELDEVSNTFVGLSTPEFVAAKGYSIRAPNTFDPNPNAAPQTFNGVFNGVPNNGDITIPMTYSGAGKGFNLLGNPYPSTIDADAFLDANTSIGTIYFWTHSQQGASSAANYASYNSTGQAAASTTTPVSATPNGTIQVGQGFLASTTTATDATFTNDMRVNNTANQFFRALANEKNRIWLNLSNATEVVNQTLLGYVSNATNAVDTKFDGKLIETDGSKLYSFLNDSEYVIQGRALPFVDSDSVALGFKAATDGNYTITLDHVDGLFSGDQNIFIKDNLTGTVHNIKESAYTFASNAGTFNNRFAVVYQAAPLGIENPGLNADNIVVFNQNGILNINAGTTVMQAVKVFDIRGRLLFDNKNVNATTTAIQNLGDTKQVLVIQITSEDNKTVSKKVVF